MRRRNAPVAEQHHREALLRPPDKTFKQKLKNLIWDSEKRTCLTRSPINWLCITIYYFIFLACVIFLFFISLQIVYYMSKNKHRPQYILEDSPIGTSPSLNYFPLSDSKPLIWLSSKRSYEQYVNEIEKIFREYKKANASFTTDNFKDCSKAPFGYDEKSPCIFFRLNRIILWKPTPYKRGDSLPSDLPQEVKDSINSSDNPKIWLTCNGTTAKDRDHISQDFFQLQGSKGFDISAFPFDGQKNFVDPIVALKLNDSNSKKTLYSFTCTAWSNKLDVNKTAVDVLYFFE